MEETFTYDDMNRLTGITLKRPSGQDLYCSVSAMSTSCKSCYCYVDNY